jgi:hypothetical protein
MSGTSANGMGRVGTSPTIRWRWCARRFPRPIAPLEPIDVPAAGDPVGFVTIAADEKIVRLGMGDVAVDVAAVIQEIMVRARLPAIVQLACPVVQGHRTADEFAGGDGGVRVKSRKKGIPIESIHAAAEPYQAIENVLPVEQLCESGGSAAGRRSCSC